LADLDAEIARAHRANARLIAVYVDVTALKVVNDERGHAAGDALLQRVVVAIRSCLRSYDLVVRVGGDEFLCVLPGATAESARRRFQTIRDELAGNADPSAIRVGVTALRPDDSAAGLMARADADLPHTPRR
jgi:diguanylate cyclase (GGDEF)-like protein